MAIDLFTATQVAMKKAEIGGARQAGLAAGRAQAEAEIAGWLEGQAAEQQAIADAKRTGWMNVAAKALALRQAAEAVRQGRARREGA